MATIKYDVSGIDVKDGGDFPLVPKGVYPVKVHEATAKESKAGNDMIELVLEISRGEFKGAKLWYYAVYTGSETDFGFAAMVKAFKLKGKGTINPDRLVGKPASVRVKHEMWEDEPRAKVAALMAPGSDTEPDDEDEDEPDDEDDEGTTDDLTIEDLEEMDLDELKEIIEEEELDIRVTKRSKPETVAAKIADALELESADDEDEDEEDEEDEEDDEDEDDYDEWSVQELRDEAKSRELKSAGSKKALIARLRKDDAEDGDPF